MKILLATDGSANSQECIKHLGNFADWQSTQVHIVVVSDQSMLSPHHIDQAMGRQIIEGAQDAIARLFPHMTLSSDLRSGNAPEQILQALREFGPDIVLAGAHAPRSFPKEFFGSVANELIDQADCSIRLVRICPEPSRIIVCLENSSLDQATIEEIKRLYWPPGAVLRLVHVLDVPAEELSENPKVDATLFYKRQEEQRAQMQIALDQRAAEIRQVFPQLEIETCISHEMEVDEVILELAAAWPADLIMVGSHRRRGMDKFWLGTVAQPVAARSKCSVHITRAQKTTQ